MSEVLEPVRIEEPEEKVSKAVFVLYSFDGDPVAPPIPVVPIRDGTVIWFDVNRGKMPLGLPTGYTVLFIDGKPLWTQHLRQRIHVIEGDRVWVTMRNPTNLMKILHDHGM